MSNVPDSGDANSAMMLRYAQLLSLAAHEFRTPASVVSGYLRMLQKDVEEPLTERQRKMVDEAAKSCARLVALVSELSELGRLDSNSAPVKDETFDLFAELDDVAGNVHEGEDREVKLQLSGRSAGARITADRLRLNAAFQAYFRALLREQPTAVTMVGDRRLVQETDRTSAVVTIARQDDVQRAYAATAQPFDDHRGGVGLSLPIARRIIERAGGRVWAPRPADEADRGLRSAVVISIPLAE
jgi:signal transduction histidine kinase